MAYTANEQIAIAESSSPLGPFKQKVKQPLVVTGKQIDPYVFIDDLGKVYLYHVRLENGNRIFVAELTEDLSEIKSGTLKACISADEPWENKAGAEWPVVEGPSVLKENGLYYLVYSANDFRNINYAVGYAVSKDPLGPWEKCTDNPVLSKEAINQHGPGHGDLFYEEKGNLRYVFHTHQSDTSVNPRKTALIDARIEEGRLMFDNKTFHFLRLQE